MPLVLLMYQKYNMHANSGPGRQAGRTEDNNILDEQACSQIKLGCNMSVQLSCKTEGH